MRLLTLLLATTLFFGATAAQADPATEKAIRDLVIAGNAYVKKNLKGEEGTIAKEGSTEFWSSGGLLQQVPADATPQEFDSFAIDVKHITVVTLVPGQAAAAFYYSEGSLKPKGRDAVGHYLTRVMEVYVKEDGKWKLRGAHWSPIRGGSGTSQTSVN